MAASALDLARNFSLYTIPAAWAIGIVPHFYAAGLGRFDNRNPRTYTREVEADQRLDKATKATIIRAEAAQMNSFENIGLFAAAVVVGNVANLDNRTLNTLSVGYLAVRIVYNFVYIQGSTNAMSYLRSTTFLAGIGIVFTLFIKSANVLREKV